MKIMKIKEDSLANLKLTKQQKKDLVNRHIDRKLERWDFLQGLSWESIYYGFSRVNVAYLHLFVFFNFIIFRYCSNSLAYYLATILSCFGVLLYAEQRYGHVE
mmetsp:Transcript_4929/g.6550  ORF Transcript_4929/g.6550 Transcript_4929/m.6550 type:complete len:103 (+) Transcript_4929:107-415(+)